jgi:hypothetical protein
MFSTLRTRFGIPGVISVIALVFAMFGGAYAASNSSNNGKATASAKAKKGPKGPKGATGPAGPAGAQGPAGPAGAKGDAGANGSNGAAGPTGAAGAKGATGAAGATGATGFSGFTETLPAGKTETGTWSVTVAPIESSFNFNSTISFPIPVDGTGDAFYFSSTQVSNEEFGSSGCHWETFNAEAKPEAATPGTLCVFEQFGNREYIPDPPFFSPPGEPFPLSSSYGPAGAYMAWAKSPSAEPREANAIGVWAVTAPEP